ncbi:MAG TPA: hypothetical protein VMZ92_05925 [Planctomycetota bacterium]|nr:hypothetical protein [Planctomycetota bacterium]
MVHFLKKGLLLGLAALFLCCMFGCKGSAEKKEPTGEAQPEKIWGDDTRRNILDGAE